MLDAIGSRLAPSPSHPCPPSLPQLRCYRLLDFFSFLTYSLAYPLLYVTLLRNVLVSWHRAGPRARS